MSISSNPPLPPLLTPKLPIIPNSTHSSKMPSEQLMALIFVLTLQLQPGPTIATGKVGSSRMSWLPQHLTCIFATSSVAGREVLLMGVFHDARVHDFHVPEGKFYLADAGYPLCDVLLVPFHGVQYHLREWESCALWNVI